VCDELQAALSASDSRIAVEGPAVRLWYDAAQLIGLAIHELATNSIKFGVLSSSADRARLSIRWRVTGDIMTITWRETGVAILALRQSELVSAVSSSKRRFPTSLVR